MSFIVSFTAAATPYWGIGRIRHANIDTCYDAACVRCARALHNLITFLLYENKREKYDYENGGRARAGASERARVKT